VDWINPRGTKKVHSLIDKVYKRKNLEMAWEKVKENRGSGGIDEPDISNRVKTKCPVTRTYQELSVRHTWCTLRVRWGRVRSAERAEAHLLEIDFCEPSFGPICGRRAIR